MVRPVASLARQRDGNQLITEKKIGRKKKITEKYALSPDDRELYLTLRIEREGLKHPVMMRLVYERS